ncbi:MAG: glycosyltransferase family 4 protein [Schleiferiaceae bacterium]|jgi:glycosyltransferase involved in cell wall biosynthesis|nr:glycosyltransferase family 4 protein [Schleiferiaceae bacterium]
MKILFLSRSTLFSQPGGDTIQVKETANALQEMGIEVDIHLKGEEIFFNRYDLIHFFNLGRPADILPYLHKIMSPIIVSTIFVEYGKGFFQHTLEYAKTIGRWLNGSDVYPGWLYLQMRQKNAIQLVIDRSKFLVTSTSTEAQRIQKNWKTNQAPRMVPLGLSESFINNTKPEGKREGFLVVGRIEKLKNQKMAIQASNDLELKLKIIGQAAKNQSSYFEECQKLANSQVEFLPYLETADLIEEYQKAETLIMPSHFETFGLVALEAWSQGCKLILSNKIESKSFFEDKALFFDPENLNSLTDAIEKSKDLPNINPDQDLLKKHSWKQSAKALVRLYESSVF